jgi:hypothetical protein
MILDERRHDLQTLTYEPTLPKIEQFPECGQYRLNFAPFFNQLRTAGELQSMEVRAES